MDFRRLTLELQQAVELADDGRLTLAVQYSPADRLFQLLSFPEQGEQVGAHGLVGVLLQAQMFCALLALLAGLTLEKVTLLRPERRARAGTEAEIATDPVEVAPSEPCVAASAAGAPAPMPAPSRATTSMGRARQ